MRSGVQVANPSLTVQQRTMVTGLVPDLGINVLSKQWSLCSLRSVDTLFEVMRKTCMQQSLALLRIYTLSVVGHD